MDWNTKKALNDMINDLNYMYESLKRNPDINLSLARQKVIEAKALIRQYLSDNEITEE